MREDRLSDAGMTLGGVGGGRGKGCFARSHLMDSSTHTLQVYVIAAMITFSLFHVMQVYMNGVTLQMMDGSKAESIVWQ